MKRKWKIAITCAVLLIAPELLLLRLGQGDVRVGFLRAQLAVPSRSAQVSAIRHLGDLGPASAPAVSCLLEFQAAEDASLRAAATRALGEVGVEPHRVVPVLAAALQDDDPQVRECAAFSLGLFGPEAADAVPQLIQASDASHPHWEDRVCAVAVLGKIGPAAQSAGPALLSIVASTDEAYGLRMLAADALRQVDAPESSGAVEVLANELEGSDPRDAMNLLMDFGPAAAGAIPRLIGLLRHDDWEHRQRAAWTLGAIGEPAQEAVPSLIDALDDPEADVVCAATRALSEVAPNEKRVVAAITGTLVHGDSSVYVCAALTLGEMGSKARDAIPALEDAARRGSRLAKRALRRIRDEE